MGRAAREAISCRLVAGLKWFFLGFQARVAAAKFSQAGGFDLTGFLGDSNFGRYR